METTKPQYVCRLNYTIPTSKMDTSHVLSSMVATKPTNPTLEKRVEMTCILECSLSTKKFSHLSTIPFEYFSAASRI
jgi:hypothetical protein